MNTVTYIQPYLKENNSSHSGKLTDQQKLRFLDGLRGIAALYVMIGHSRWLLWEGYSAGYLTHSESYSLFQKILVYFFSLFVYGHEVVLFFFLLSGFVIHLNNTRKLNARKTTFKFLTFNFYQRRFTRLYPAFLFSLLLTLILDSVGLWLGFPIYTHQTLYSQLNDNIGNDISFPTFLGNLLMLQNTYFPVYGSNGPLWSLKFEWWFYMFYPALLLGLKRSISGLTFCIVLLFFFSYWPQYWPSKLFREIFTLLIFWWGGVLLAEFYCDRIARKSVYIFTALFLAVYILFSEATNNVLKTDVLFGIVFFIFLQVLLSMKLTQFHKALAKLKWLGDCSYTLYVIHFPILTFVSGCLIKQNRELPSNFYLVAASVPVLVFTAWLLHFILEKPFMNNQSRLSSNSKTGFSDKPILTQ